ncbi:nitrile hydratase subunit beta [Oceanobacillus alkalisoli]|uniref:nitrile hydratase subunit beta n=1 Tax=Oceanobacillus alkalisoli TaxID=2925113 RepID=UPI001EF1070D|nr:nitrile hydratase subunit beta [Oceanobacillus alkalisoli]MCF3942866.1 nitrile hydratase subunit beta [Oceanobacillus alkalisoli]MCG5102410.1 nitrile hydratase subunit beta [Oceanobacillus alkalisoli]
MNEDKTELSAAMGRMFGQIVKERVATEALANLLIEKGIITAEELDESFRKVYEEKGKKYSAEALNMSEEEYREIIDGE